MVKASSLREDGFAAALVLAVLIPLDPIMQEHSLLRSRSKPAEDLEALPQTPAGDLVKASSLREDGFAAALVLAVLIPLHPIMANAYPCVCGYKLE